MLILFNQQRRCNMMLYVHMENNRKMLFICLPQSRGHGEERRPIYSFLLREIKIIRNSRIQLWFEFRLVAGLSTFWFMIDCTRKTFFWWNILCLKFEDETETALKKQNKALMIFSCSTCCDTRLFVMFSCDISDDALELFAFCWNLLGTSRK